MMFAALCLVVSSSAFAADKYVTVKCTVPSGEGGYEVPCPKKYGVPGWLTRLLKALSIPGGPSGALLLFH